MSLVLTVLGFLLMGLGLAYHFAALKIFNLLVPKERAVERRKGLAYGPHARHRLDLYMPVGEGPWPVLLFVYGGSWDSGSRTDYGFVGHAFAAQGFLTAIADYRLVPHVHYPDFVEDSALALTWLSREAAGHGGDGRKLFALGHSAGAYTAVQAVLRNGLHSHVTAMASLAGPFDFLPLDSPKTIAAFGKVADLKETQPVHGDFAQAPPLMLLHGREDTTVGLYNSWNMHAAYVRQARTAVLRIYDTVGHVGIMLALAKPLRWRAPVLHDVTAFFQRYL